MIKQLLHIHQRRALLSRIFDIKGDFSKLAESCIPSYTNPNRLIALGFWWRLFASARLAGHLSHDRPVLDFGAAVGELAHLLPKGVDYHFMESDPWLVSVLETLVPHAQNTQMEQAAPATYQTIFALDALEHNHNPGMILAQLSNLLAHDGSMIISGPTENILYRLGRKIAGYPDHYHHFTIYQLEQLANEYLICEQTITGPFWLPLFRISKWKKRTDVSPL
ncbi:MAG: class I SAM-dependent methyltransferase [Magnetococcales bacterium]|nr:class I SAM-dependent methyltransferase [Magnetococcales bacterium]